VPHNPSNAAIHLEEITTRNDTARRALAGFTTAMPTLADVWQIIESALADTPTLAAEITSLRAELADTRLDHADLLAAARATLAAHRDREADPLSYLRDELETRGQLPPGSWRQA
jgi:hypothetical protein